jgi:hypothetical protein
MCEHMYRCYSNSATATSIQAAMQLHRILRILRRLRESEKWF